MIKMLTVSFGLLALVACTKPVTSWHQPGVSHEQWSEERRDCYNWSRRKAEQDMADRAPSITHDATDTGFRQFMSGYDSKRSQQQLMDTCLRRLGYQPAQEKNP